jgi:hypothetical protein
MTALAAGNGAGVSFSIANVFFFVVFVVFPVVLLLIAWSFRRWLRRLATRAGYPTIGKYLRTPPSSDAERQDAVDMALKGLVICLLGMIFPPAVLLGIFPLFYGGRKLAYAWMGLGLVDDAEPPRG